MTGRRSAPSARSPRLPGPGSGAGPSASSRVIAAMRVRKSLITRKLGVAVVADLVGARLADPVERRLHAGNLVGHDLDDDPPAVGRVGDAPDVAGLLEPVDDPGDRAGRQAHELRERPAVVDARVDEDLERLDVGLGQAEPDGHGLAEERSLEVDPAQRPEDRIDADRGSWLTTAPRLGNYLHGADIARRC